jgi:5-methylcytosine-specific restriction protein A
MREPWRNWYSRPDWRRKRALQLKRQPLCQGIYCKVLNKLTPATTVDHITPHHGDFTGFMHGALQSLCDSCHARKWADDRRGYSTAIGADGRPIDPRHPANAESVHQPTPERNWPAETPASPPEDEAKPDAPESAPGAMPRHLAALLGRNK